MAKLNANRDRPRVAASSIAWNRAASQPIRTMPKTGVMTSRITEMTGTPRHSSGALA
jgi:hypothetical protein